MPFGGSVHEDAGAAVLDYPDKLLTVAVTGWGARPWVESWAFEFEDTEGTLQVGLRPPSYRLYVRRSCGGHLAGWHGWEGAGVSGGANSLVVDANYRAEMQALLRRVRTWDTSPRPWLDEALAVVTILNRSSAPLQRGPRFASPTCTGNQIQPLPILARPDLLCGPILRAVRHDRCLEAARLALQCGHPKSKEAAMAESETYRKGQEMRRKLLGDDYVERITKTVYADPVMKKFIDVSTETAFGALWTRPGLDLKTRTLVVVVSDAATGRTPELAIHLRMALRQGWTEDELVEVLLHLTAYVGLPMIREAMLTAKEVFAEARKER